MKSYRLIGLLIPVFLLVYGETNNNSVATGNVLEEKEKLNLVTVHAEDAHLPSILAILAKESGYNIVTDPNVNRQEKISIHLDEVPIEQAINLVVRAVGLSYEVVGNSFNCTQKIKERLVFLLCYRAYMHLLKKFEQCCRTYQIKFRWIFQVISFSKCLS